MASLDELRKAYPHLGFAVYALTPGGLVTLEVHAPNGDGPQIVFTFEGPTLAAAVAAAFSGPPAATPPAPQPDPVNVFD